MHLSLPFLFKVSKRIITSIYSPQYIHLNIFTSIYSPQYIHLNIFTLIYSPQYIHLNIGGY